jgi:FHA domain
MGDWCCIFMCKHNNTKRILKSNMVKTIGRAVDNTIVIPNPDISLHHAKITYLGDDSFLIEDLSSTNGVYVNGYRTLRAKVSVKDEVCLAASAKLNLSTIFSLGQQVKQDPPKQSNDYRNDFLKLKQTWGQYQQERIRINNQYQKKSTIVRSILSIAPLGVWVIFQATYLSKFETTDPHYVKWQGSFIYFSVIGGAIGNLVGGLLIAPPMAKLSQLDEEFRITYVCPNPDCRIQLGNIPWQSYYNQGKCLRCQTKYSNENQTPA